MHPSIAPPTPKLGSEIRKKFTKQKVLFLFMLPGFVYFLVFKYYPMYGVIMAFQDFNPVLGFNRSEFVGFQNFRYIFGTPNFLAVLRNTILISVLKIVISFPAPIILALMINEMKHLPLKKAVQTMSYMPHFISWVVAAGIWYNFLSGDGIVNDLLMRIGILDGPFYFMGSRGFAYPLLVGSDIWKGVGFGSIIYLAALAGVNPELYESARVDGAGRIRQMWHISLPGIKTTMVILLILRIANLLEAGFDQIQAFMNPQTRPVVNIIETEVWRMLTTGGMRQLSVGAALSVFQAVTGLVLFLLANLAVRALDEESFI